MSLGNETARPIPSPPVDEARGMPLGSSGGGFLFYQAKPFHVLCLLRLPPPNISLPYSSCLLLLLPLPPLKRRVLASLLLSSR